MKQIQHILTDVLYMPLHSSAWKCVMHWYGIMFAIAVSY